MKKVLLSSLVLCFILSFRLELGVEKVDVQGSTTILPIMQIIAEELWLKTKTLKLQ